jgi:aminoglycoside phosphotransferase (APT) family kinase protein
VHEWLPGDAAVRGLEVRQQSAVDLAGFVRALRGIDTSGAPIPSHGGRGRPLSEVDDAVRRAVADLGNRIDGRAALRSWDESVSAPGPGGPPEWFHGDLLPGNLLVRRGRLSAVIDFGSLAVGDAACDLQPGWHLFDGTSRDCFLDETGADATARLRGRGWVLAQCVIALPYYWETNPGIVLQSQRALGEVLADTGTSA